MRALHISGEIDQSAILRFEADLLDGPAPTVDLSSEYRSSDPLTRASLLQLLTSWSRSDGDLMARFADVTDSDSLRERLSAEPLSFLVSLFADVVLGHGGTDFTELAGRERALFSRNHSALYPWSAFDSGPGVRILAAPFDPNSAVGSPDLGSRCAEGWRTDFASRTLYTPVDLERILDDEVESLSNLAESQDHTVAKTEIHRPRLVRNAWPPDHPLLNSGLTFEALGPRLLPVGPVQLAAWREFHAADSSPGDWLGHAVYELVQNAERHATKSIEGAPLSSPVTLVIAERFSSVDIARSQCAAPLAAYLDGAPASDYVSITVLDCGDGLAATAAWRAIRRAPQTPEEEAGYLRTAVSGALRERSGPLHGFGLPLVQHLVSDLRGFIRVRSGQTVVYRDYRRSSYSVVNDDPMGWRHDTDDEVERFRRRGTAFTIVVPRVDS